MSFLPRNLAAPSQPSGPVIDWEEANCLLCGSNRWVPLIEAPDNLADGDGLWFAVVRCQDCGLCFTNPRPSMNSISQFYPALYWPHRAPKKRLDGSRRLRPIHRWCPPRRERRVLSSDSAARLLDFGCGSGVFLERMHQLGWQVTGLDVCAEAVEVIRREFGLRALVGTLPHPELMPGSFDVITMWHSLEHVHQPQEILRHAFDLLSPGGNLMAAVPNIDSLPFRWFGASWYGLDLPRHLTHFSPDTLRWMLEQTGFQVGSIRMIRQSGWLRSSAEIFCRTRHSSSWHHWLQNKHAARLATWYSYLTRQCDCLLATATRE
jgi:2-polyprenyl-3-methyl-5-hydroxy-6-metoxy-1,4-benzoquinol methylase